MKNLSRILFLLSLTIYLHSAARAGTINFDDLPDGTVIGNKYAAAFGVTFAGATIADQGKSLNSSFPPRSAPGVAWDSDATMSIEFGNKAQPVFQISFYFTTNDNMSALVFDTNGNLINANIDFFVGCNYLFNVNCLPPNKLARFGEAVRIGSIELFSDDGPNSFTIDDLTFTTPEPTMLVLMSTGLLSWPWGRCKRK